MRSLVRSGGATETGTDGGMTDVKLPLGLEYMIELMKGIVLPSLTS